MAHQLPLVVPYPVLTAIAELPDTAIQREGGSRQSILLLADDMESYYAKSPVLMPAHPYIAVNELLANRLARYTGLPVRNAEIIRWNGNLYAGVQILSRKMTGGINAANWVRLKNAPAVAYDIVAFDIWVLNPDRHPQNWLGGMIDKTTGWFMANDHDLAILGQGRPPSALPARIPEVDAQCLRVPEICNSVTDPAALAAAVARVEAIADATIEQLVDGVPDVWLAPADRKYVVELLVGRKHGLAALIAGHHAQFPNLP